MKKIFLCLLAASCTSTLDIELLTRLSMCSWLCFRVLIGFLNNLMLVQVGGPRVLMLTCRSVFYVLYLTFNGCDVIILA